MIRPYACPSLPVNIALKSSKGLTLQNVLTVQEAKAKPKWWIYLSKGIDPGNWHWSYVTKLNINIV